MRVVAVTEPGTIALMDVPSPQVGKGSLVCLERAGICGTDLKIMDGSTPVDYPRVLGHELVGTVLGKRSREGSQPRVPGSWSTREFTADAAICVTRIGPTSAIAGVFWEEISMGSSPSRWRLTTATFSRCPTGSPRMAQVCCRCWVRCSMPSRP